MVQPRFERSIEIPDRENRPLIQVTSPSFQDRPQLISTVRNFLVISSQIAKIIICALSWFTVVVQGQFEGVHCQARGLVEFMGCLPAIIGKFI